MHTTYMTRPERFCPDCKETGGVIPAAPLVYYCMAQGECPTPEKQCEYVQHGGVRP